MSVYLIRHAHAGQRARGFHDQFRPLSDRGRARADQLVDILADLNVTAVWSSPSTRCMQTVEPTAVAHGVEVVEEEVFGEESPVCEALNRLAEAPADGDVLVCSHGNLIPEIVGWLADNDGITVRGRGCEKGSIWVLDRNESGWTNATYLGMDRAPSSRS